MFDFGEDIVFLDVFLISVKYVVIIFLEICDFFLMLILIIVLKYVFCKFIVRREDLINFCLKFRILFMEFWRKIVFYREYKYMYIVILDFLFRYRLNVSGYLYCFLFIDIGDNKIKLYLVF